MQPRPDDIPGYYTQADGKTAWKDGVLFAERWTQQPISQDTSLFGRIIDATIVTLATAVNPVAGLGAKLVIASNNAPVRAAAPVSRPSPVAAARARARALALARAKALLRAKAASLRARYYRQPLRGQYVRRVR